MPNKLDSDQDCSLVDPGLGPNSVCEKVTELSNLLDLLFSNKYISCEQHNLNVLLENENNYHNISVKSCVI